MQVVELKIEDNTNDNLKEFYSLIRKGNNKITLTKKSAIYTDEMIDDIYAKKSVGWVKPTNYLKFFNIMVGFTYPTNVYYE